MFGLFRASKSGNHGRKAPAHPAVPTPAIAPRSGPSRRREIVEMGVKDTLRKHGIPAGWLDAEVLSFASEQVTGTHVRLVLTKWMPQLLHFAPALEAEFQSRIGRLDTTVDTWLTGFSWRLKLAEDTERDELPPHSFWKELDELQNVQKSRRDLLEEFVSEFDSAHSRLDFRPTQPMLHYK